MMGYDGLFSSMLLGSCDCVGVVQCCGCCCCAVVVLLDLLCYSGHYALLLDFAAFAVL